MSKRPFCVCGHSYWSHNYPMQVLSDPLSLRCERIGCRCGEYVPKPEPDNSGSEER